MASDILRKDIGLIALDLDGTLLRSDHTIGMRTREALKKAMDKGVHVVIATGRPLSALPEAALEIEGIGYAATANGARITELASGRNIYSSFIEEKTAGKIIDMLSSMPYMVEIFTGDKAYVESRAFEDLEKYGIKGKSTEYVRNTRIPVEDLYGFARKNIATIENININFADMDEKKRMWKKFSSIEGVTATMSLKRNIELGGKTTSKAAAVHALADILGVSVKGIMACGDSLNDLAMLRAADLSVAMGNSKHELLEEADFIAPDNEHDGVGVAVEKFVLQP